MSDAASTGEIAGIIAAIVVGLTAIGKGVQWLLSFHERRTSERNKTREAKLEAWHQELARRESALDGRLEGRLASLEDAAAVHGEQSMALRMAFELVASALRSIDPMNTALSRAEQLLQKAFPLAPIVPPDMTAQLRAIERIDTAATAAGRQTGAGA